MWTVTALSFAIFIRSMKKYQTIVGSLRVVADGLGILGLPIQITLKQFDHLAGSGHLDRFGREGAFPIGTGQIGDGTILPIVRDQPYG